MNHLLSIVSILATAASLLGNDAGPVAYTPGSTGYDISYPQCAGAYPAGAFGIVGVDGGYPFVHSTPASPLNTHSRQTLPSTSILATTRCTRRWTASTPPKGVWRSRP